MISIISITRNADVAKKADRTAYDVRYSCRTEPAENAASEKPCLLDRAALGAC